jgi:GTP-binding protein
LKVVATFVKSAASAVDLPREGLAEVALVGRSNVGKSSLINALVRQRVARTSAAPGKTRLANIYRVDRGTAFYLVDLPGYGFARGERAELDAVTRAYFGHEGQEGRDRHERRTAVLAALLLVDVRHPGLSSDIEAWRWLQSTVQSVVIVGTKVDKLARGERIRAMRELESVFDAPVLPVSAASGEGLDELWKLIDRLVNTRNSSRRDSRKALPAPETAPRPPRRPRRRSSGSTSPRSRT